MSIDISHKEKLLSSKTPLIITAILGAKVIITMTNRASFSQH